MLLGAAMLLLPAVAVSKVVGVVFDDSGSMSGYAHLPALGIQMLAGSLTKTDQLYAVRFRSFIEAQRRAGPIQEGLGPEVIRNLTQRPEQLDVAGAQQLQTTLQRIRAWPQRVVDGTGTPYAAVELMLDRLLAASGPDKPAVLLVFTDGEFSDSKKPDALQMPPPLRIRQNLERYRSQYPDANLTVYFLVFDPTGAKAQLIEQQGVAAHLIEVFPGAGDEQGGSRFLLVRRFSELRHALTGIIAAISDTSVEGGSGVVERTGDTLRVQAPFTITQLITLATGRTDTEAPQLQRRPQGVADVQVFTAEMTQADRKYGDDAEATARWRALITQINPWPALPANQVHEFGFSHGPLDDLTVLFKTAIGVDWEIVDATGQPVREDQGTWLLSTGEAYEVRARIVDGGSQPPRVVSFRGTELPPDTRLTLLRRERDGDRAVTMEIDRTQDHATARLDGYGAAQDLSLMVTVALPGFVTSTSRPIKVLFREVGVDLEIQAEPVEACAGCGPEYAEVALDDGDDWQPALRLAVTARPRGEQTGGSFTLSSDTPLPPGLRIRSEATGAVLAGAGAGLSAGVTAGTPAQFIVEADAAFRGRLPDGAEVAVTATMTPPLVGTVAHRFRIVPRLGQVRLVRAGDSLGGQGDAPLALRPDQLNGDDGLYVQALGVYGPLRAADFKVEIAGLEARVLGEGQRDVVRIAPTYTGDLPCRLLPGPRRFSVVYENESGQRAALAGQLRIAAMPWPERIALCGAQIILLAILLWLFAGFLRRLTTHFFPHRSRLYVYRDGFPDEAVRHRLHGSHLRYLWPLVWPWRRWHERFARHGLSLEAAPGGPLLRWVPSEYAGLQRRSTGLPLSEYFRNSDRSPLELTWGESLRETSDERTVYELVEDARRAPR
jgi:hypothetical protein